MIVVKLGGSLIQAGTVRRWIEVVTAATRPVVVVPGGGPFADTVRDVQAALGFDDRVAHPMALLAMDQMGLALCGLSPRFACVRSLRQIWDPPRAGQIPVWLPYSLAAEDPKLPASWDVTSDSVAARLAEMLHASALVLVKSVSVDEDASPEVLAARGIVDKHLPQMLSRAHLRLQAIGPDDEKRLAALLR